MATETVIFDFYGTLVGPAAPTRTIAELMAALGVQITAEIAERWSIDQLDGVLHEEASASEEAYEAWQRGRWEGMLTDCGVARAEQARIVGAIEAQVASFRVSAFPEAAGVLAELRRSGLRLGICSNWHWDLDSYVVAAGLDGAVDVAITSARIGARKHHPLVYDRTLELLGAEAATTLFVGDSWAPDVLGPIEAGMRAVHVHRGDHDAPALPHGAARTADLTGVLAHI